MIKIYKREDCCGCSACQQVCPQECITLIPDNEGFNYPHVSLEKCIDCHLCEKVCPVINQGTERTPIEVYAAYNNNEDIRAKSSSGGIFSLIAEKVIQNKGVVFGVKFDSDLNVTFGYTDTIEGIDQFRGSKYVQARLGDTYKNAAEFLKDGRLVLFSGTPCQVAGLKGFLNKDYPNLLTLDIICEGVPSQKIWKRYIEEEFSDQYKKLFHTNGKYKKDFTVKQFTFRNKTIGWKQHGISFVICDNSTEKTFPVSMYRHSAYLQALFHYVILRPVCYECPFKKCKSQSDITIADYWGINYLHPEMDDNKGTSMVYLNTEKGKAFFHLDKTTHLRTKYEEAFYFNNILTSVKKHKNRDKFYSKIDNCKSIIKLMNRCTFPLSYKIMEITKATLSVLISQNHYKTLERIWRKVRK